MKILTNEVKTGIVVVAAILATMIFYIKTTGTTGAPYKIYTYFNHADGIKEDAIVKLAGIEVGRVTKIGFKYEPETKIMLELAVKPAFKVHEDAIAFIATSGMIGDAYVGLTPGSADKPFIKNGGTVASEDPVEVRKFWKKADAIADALDKTLGQIKNLAENINGAVTDNRPRLDSIMMNIEQTAINFKDFSQDLKAHPWKLLIKGKD
ncbi:MAG: MlaD family protein [Candidatus Omnitrophica bacterium]|nr:MlaD family protein [Candidatus Omnitrophota bacterium]MCM8791044.1 MlaD family protein [Candidatus Omnitrophota bacterium]